MILIMSVGVYYNMTKLSKVAIVIPFHKATLSVDEKISVSHLVKFLGKYDKFLILPESIKRISFKIPKTEIIHFPDEYFISVPKYCEMLNIKNFYEKFSKYQYILIHQLDVLVFSDQLLKWYRAGYDYVGAPWLNPLIGRLTKNKTTPLNGGNGGFSLRKVNSFLEVIEKAEALAKRETNNFWIRKLWFIIAVVTGQSHKIWLNAPAYCYPFNEDGFWSYEAPKYKNDFKVAPLKESIKFSFEENPRRCFKLNSNKLPFGCHAWAKYDRQFWNPYLLPK